MPWFEASNFRQLLTGHEIADGVVGLYIGHRVGTGSPAQRALIHDLQTALNACQGEVEYYHSIAAKKPGGLEEQKLRRELNSVRRERDRARDELAALKEQHKWSELDAEQLRATLDEIRSSTSWKVTAPLRKIRGGAATSKDEGQG